MRSRVSSIVLQTTLKVLLTCLVLANLGLKSPVESKKIIQIGGFYAAYDNGKVNYSGIVAAVDMARRSINNRTDVLSDYEIQVDWKDTRCNRKYGTYSLYQLVSSPPVKLMLIGGVCSVSTQPIAETSHLFNLLQVGYGASSPSLSDTKVYPSFFRTNAADDLANMVRLAFMRHFNWSRVGIIYQDMDIFSKTAYSLISLLEDNNFTVTAEKFSDDPTEQVKSLKNEDIRIIVALFYATEGRQVLCRAYKEGVTGDRYVWLMIGWLSPFWWETPANSSEDCTSDQIRETAGNFFDMDFLKLSPDPSPTEGGKSANDTYLQYQEEVKQRGLPEALNWVPSAYDAMWAIALALNASDSYLKKTSSKTLTNFTYKDTAMAELFKSMLKNVTFRGMTGLVSFDENGGAERKIIIQQLQGGTRKVVGYYTVNNDSLDLTNYQPIIWPGGHPPADRKQTINQKSTISEKTYIIICVLFSSGIILAFVFLIFNLKNSSHLFVKMSSPGVNNMIIIGCILLYVAGIIYGMDSTITESSIVTQCTAFQCLAAVGFSLSFGSMFAKIWRVHVIFVKRVEKSVRDCQLYGVIVLLLVLDIIVIVTSHAVDPMYTSTKFLDKEEETEDGSQVIKHYMEYCDSQYSIVFAGIIFAYKGVLLLFAAFLSWETRHVTVPYLNDSRFIGLGVYNVLVPCALGVPLIYLVTDEQDVVYMVITFLIMFCTVVTLCLIFIPKIRMVKRDPDESETAASMPECSRSSNNAAAPYTATTVPNDNAQSSAEAENVSEENPSSNAEAIVLNNGSDLYKETVAKTNDSPEVS